MAHGTLTVITKIRKDPRGHESLEGLEQYLEALRRALTDLGPEVDARLAGIEELHFARWIVLDRAPGEQTPKSSETYLIFAADYYATREDVGGDLDRGFLERVIDALWTADDGALLYKIYGDCEGVPANRNRKALEEVLLGGIKSYAARHVAFAYRAEQPRTLRDALELRGKLDALLDEEHRQGNRPTPETLRKAVKRWPGLLPDVARGREAARAAAAQATFAYGLRELLARFLVWYLGLRQRLGRQLRGPAVPKMGEPAGSPRLARHIMPDSPVQNPMVHVAGLPPDGKKLEKARKRIKAVNLRMSRYLVGLNRVSSIHCARWVEFKTEGGENRLLFLSNYDGSWDGYIDSFLDTAEINFFLREMWKHTRGFTDRAATSSGVKRWIRERLEPTPIFFSAYQARAEKPVNAAPPPPSIADIHKAVQLREALRTEGEAEDALLAHYIRTGDCPPEPSLLTLGQAISLAWAERRRAAEAKRLAAEAKRRMAQPATAPTP